MNVVFIRRMFDLTISHVLIIVHHVIIILEWCRGNLFDTSNCTLGSNHRLSPFPFNIRRLRDTNFVYLSLTRPTRPCVLYSAHRLDNYTRFGHFIIRIYLFTDPSSPTRTRSLQIKPLPGQRKKSWALIANPEERKQKGSKTFWWELVLRGISDILPAMISSVNIPCLFAFTGLLRTLIIPEKDPQSKNKPEQRFKVCL